MLCSLLKPCDDKRIHICIYIYARRYGVCITFNLGGVFLASNFFLGGRGGVLLKLFLFSTALG